MLKKVKENITVKSCLCFLLVLILALQDPIALRVSGFSYLDELLALCGIFVILFRFRKCIELLKNKYIICLVGAISIFVLVGILGNVIFRYQPFKYWLIDLYTNLKFFFTLAMGFLVYDEDDKEVEMGLLAGAWASSIFLFFVFAADRLFHFYGGQVRYGIRSAELFYFHCTYLAGTMAFLTALLLVFYRKYNLILMLGNIVIMFFTLRSKAIATAFIFVILWIQIMWRKRDIKLWHIVSVGVATIALGAKQIYFYFIQLSGWSGRSIILQTCFKVMKDYFPIGTGFGTYGSHVAAEHYSPVYVKYGFLETDTLIPGGEVSYFDDQFWPIIIGQTGFIGTIAYVIAITVLIMLCWKLQRSRRSEYLAGFFIFVYLLLSSTGEPAFNNMVGIPMALVLGILFKKNELELKNG